MGNDVFGWRKSANARVLGLALVLVSCGAPACSQPLEIESGLFAAIVRDDGKIQTSFTSNRQEWEAGHVHEDIGPVDGGVGIATDESGLLVFLAFFAEDSAGRNKLFIRTGLGNNWESHLATQISIDAASAPAITRINERFFFLAWKNAEGGISTARLDSHALGDSGAFTRTGEISDPLATAVEGAPSASAMNNRILVVWKRAGANGGTELAQRVVGFVPATSSIQLNNRSEPIALPDGANPPTGFPQITNNGTRFVLASSFSRTLDASGDGEGALVSTRFQYLASDDGTDWDAPILCGESDTVERAGSRPHSLALGPGGRIFHLVSPNDQADGFVLQPCERSDKWSDVAMFDNKGAAGTQPAIAFRPGNQD